MNSDPPLNIDGTSETPKIGGLVRRIAKQEADFVDLIVELSPLILDGKPLPNEIALELSLTLHEIEHQAKINDDLYRVLNSKTSATLAVNRFGMIIGVNEIGKSFFNLSGGSHLEGIGISANEFAKFQQRLADNPAPTLMRTNGTNKGVNGVLLIGSYQHALEAFLLSVVEQNWTPSLDLALKEIYSLTPSECQIMAQLAQGKNADSIAQARGSSRNTVRQQLKTLMSKLEVATQVQAATLAASVVNALTAKVTTSDQLAMASADTNMLVGAVDYDGRRVGWRRFGKPGGQVLIFLHGPFFGAGEFAVQRQAAFHCGFDVLAVERPGYGRTDPPANEALNLDTTAEDVRHVMLHHGIAAAYLLTHEIALLPALRFSTAYPNMVRGIFSVSPSPVVTPQQLALVPPKQRVFLWSAMHAKWMTKLLIRLGLVQLRKLGSEKWIEAVFGDVENELAALKAPDNRPGVIGSYNFIMAQNGKGFELDLLVLNSDWSHLMRAAELPIFIFHGGNNKTSRVEHVREFFSGYRQVEIEVSDGFGQTLSVLAADRIFNNIATILSNTVDYSK